jgi:hypothetical protein
MHKCLQNFQNFKIASTVAELRLLIPALRHLCRLIVYYHLHHILPYPSFLRRYYRLSSSLIETHKIPMVPQPTHTTLQYPHLHVTSSSDRFIFCILSCRLQFTLILLHYYLTAIYHYCRMTAPLPARHLTTSIKASRNSAWQGRDILS